MTTASFHIVTFQHCAQLFNSIYSLFPLNSDSLVPMITVHLGEPVTFTCVLPGTELSSRQLYWYKQSAGDTLKLIVTLWKSTKPKFTPEFSESRLQVNDHRSFINLTIVKTIQEDEGMYHCAIVEWIETKWSGTYLSVKGKCNLFLQTFPVINFIKKCGFSNFVFSFCQTPEDMLVYSSVIFTMMKDGGGAIKDAKAAERERIYAAVKAFGLD
uniref:Ig-like domain-containing protein n=1 Tax=Lates calcarifer TaxID=8187 RepID=A0A4W6FCX6_LATCA